MDAKSVTLNSNNKKTIGFGLQIQHDIPAFFSHCWTHDKQNSKTAWSQESLSVLIWSLAILGYIFFLTSPSLVCCSRTIQLANIYHVSSHSQLIHFFILPRLNASTYMCVLACTGKAEACSVNSLCSCRRGGDGEFEKKESLESDLRSWKRS